MKNTKQVIALASAAALSVSVLAGCGGAASDATSESTSTATAEASNTAASDGTLVLAETGFEGKFSPFFASSASDQDVIDLTQLGLLGADRKGEMILNGIEGETREYNGTDYTYYGTSDCVVTENDDGTVTYDTQTAARDTVTTGGPETLTSLKTLLSGYTWTVARIACFADMDFANAQPDQAGLLRTGDGWLWYDDDAACWLDPGKAAAREYLVQLCKECAELGFDEILLDYCTYPVHGRLDRIDYGSVTNLTDTLSVFVEGVREALPKTTALSVLVRDQVTADANDGGVTLALLTEHFDRIYVDTDTVDAAALQGLLPADFDPVTRLVQVAAEAASSGSYVTR